MGRRQVFWIAGWAIAAIAAALSGPFGTYESMSLGGRLSYWSGMIALSFAMAAAIVRIVGRVLAGHGFAAQALAASGLMAASYATAIELVYLAIGQRLTSFLEAMALTFLISIGIALLIQQVMRESIQAVAGAGGSEAPGTRLLRRLPGELGGELLHVRARDHRLEVTTSEGTAEIPHRFADALVELEGFPGLQVHRSHWVALAAIAQAERRGELHVLRLHGGGEVPVSQPYREAVAAAGFPFPVGVPGRPARQRR